ncbi:MAG: hypothetical protein K2Q18_07620 [Bdellovibrionales bacterium]|nr:hypothetical protein [Bdellovibrionales bacterium]
MLARKFFLGIIWILYFGCFTVAGFAQEGSSIAPQPIGAATNSPINFPINSPVKLPANPPAIIQEAPKQISKLDVLVKKSEVKEGVKIEDILTLNGIRLAITSDLIKNNLDSELFWKKVEEKNLSLTNEINFFKPQFNQVSLVLAPPAVFVPATSQGQAQVVTPEDPFYRGILSYDLDSSKVKIFFNVVTDDLPDPSLKTFYIVPDIAIAKEMSWIDVGVTKEENFSGVIIESWKKWAATQFKNFPNVVILSKDLTNFNSRRAVLNPESVTLKWTSFLKKGEVYPDRKSARFDLSAQYVVVNSRTDQSIVAFDFPTQKREFTILNPKELSSNLASLVYNLLNSQTSKINSSLEISRSAVALTSVDIKVIGKHGLYDITQINSFLGAKFLDVGMVSELKSFASESSVISIKSTQAPDQLFALLGKDGGRFPLSEQKILLFSSENRTFAIIPKEANN